MKVNEINKIFGLPLDEALKVAERNKAKKPVTFHKCSECNSSVLKSQNFCPWCGQRLDWSEE